MPTSIDHYRKSDPLGSALYSFLALFLCCLRRRLCDWNRLRCKRCRTCNEVPWECGPPLATPSGGSHSDGFLSIIVLPRSRILLRFCCCQRFLLLERNLAQGSRILQNCVKSVVVSVTRRHLVFEPILSQLRVVICEFRREYSFFDL